MLVFQHVRVGGKGKGFVMNHLKYQQTLRNPTGRWEKMEKERKNEYD